MQIFFYIIFFYEKKIFSSVFLLFKASVRAQPPGPPAVPGVFSFALMYNDFPPLFWHN